MHFTGSVSVGLLPLLWLGVRAQPIPLDANWHSVAIAGALGSSVSVDLWLDLACSDSAVVWPTLGRVATAYSSHVEFRVHLLPLPYHRWAFTAAKAAEIVKALDGGGITGQGVIRFLSLAFAEQPRILNENTEQMLQGDINDLMAEWAARAADVSAAAFSAALNPGSDVGRRVEMATRYAFKFACLNGIYATPLASVNGVLVPDLANGESEDWDAVLGPLLTQAAATEPTTVTTASLREGNVLLRAGGT